MRVFLARTLCLAGAFTNIAAASIAVAHGDWLGALLPAVLLVMLPTLYRVMVS